MSVSVHTRAGWGLQREGSASVSDAPWGPSPGHWWESWGRNTQRAGRHIWRFIPIEDTCSHSVVKMLFFRQILPQFILTNGSLHTSKSYGCLNGCTAHMYTPADRHTGTHKHKQNTQITVPREKGSAASSGLVNHLLFSSNETNNKVQMEPAWGVMAVSYERVFLSLSLSHLSFSLPTFTFSSHARTYAQSKARQHRVRKHNGMHAPSRWDENNKVQMDWRWSVMVVW